MKHKAHRIVTTLGAAVAASALLAVGAAAGERPDDRAGKIGVGGTGRVAPPPPDAFERAVLRASTEAPVPDAFERAVLRETTGAIRPDDRGGLRGPGSVPVATAIDGQRADGGVHLDDALIGAGATLLLLLIGAAATLTVRHRARVILR